MNIENLVFLAKKNINNFQGELYNFLKSNLEIFKANGFKEKTQDSYKFTNIATFLQNFEPDDIKTTFEPVFSHETIGPTLFLRDGIFDRSKDIPQGISVKKVGGDFDSIRNIFQDLTPLSSLHHALLEDVLLIEIDKNVIIESPVFLINEITSKNVIVPLVIIKGYRNSSATFIVDTRIHERIHNLCLSETYVEADEGSSIELISFDSGNDQSINHATTVANLNKDATFKNLIFTGTGNLNRHNLFLNLNAPGAFGESYSLYMTRMKEHCDIFTEINHKAHDTGSAQIAKGIISDESKGIFTGKIHISPNAQRVNSSQLNKNLILSKKAQVHSQPQLEIFADDVKCYHGSTTGQLSDDEIFYFQARGIPAEKARELLAMGFALEIVQKIKNLEAKNYVENIIRKQLSSKFKLGTLK